MALRGKNILILILILVIAVLAGFIYINTPEDIKPAYSSSSVLERIIPIQEVSLIQYNYTGVVGYENSINVGKFDIPLTNKHFIAKYDGYIKAGVDFKDIKIDVQDKKIKIELPKAKVIENIIDEKSLVVYDESMNILNQIKIEDYNEVIIDEKDKMENEAIEKGILNKAGEQAELLIKAMVKDMGFEEIEITKE